MPKVIYTDSQGSERTVNLGAEPVMIGRATECQIQTSDAMVSRRHARITWDGTYWIEDLGSANGVFVGADKVQRAPFRPGDTVTCGSLVMRMMPEARVPASAAVPAAPPPPAAMAPPPAAYPAPPAAYPPPPGSFPGPPAAFAPPPSAVPMAPPPSAAPSAANATAGMAAVPSAAAGSLQALLENERQRRKLAEEEAQHATEALAAAQAKAAEWQGAGQELERWKRKAEQLQADVRRLRGGKSTEEVLAVQEADDLRVTKLSAECAQLRQQVSSLQAQLRSAGGGLPPMAAPILAAATAPGSIPVAVADRITSFGDALAELRSNLRAASDEAALLTAPADSAQMVKDSVKQLSDQIESARAQFRELSQMCGLS